MKLLDILTYPDPRLRTVAKKVEKFDKSLQDLSENMLYTMYEADGIGLAASQVDVHIRLIVMDISETRDEPLIFVNPEVEILENKSHFSFKEGCLSVPGFYEEISRPDKIKLSWQDVDGKSHTSFPEGLLTVCIQHEIDHLEGKLMVDYVSRLKRERLKKKAAK
ncbi:MAG: peptide deformylase [Proteobacteria bacterium]|jgi:peptide deformylase|nr:peptide deformylase [Pseudomonadota bacterium]